MKKVSTHSLFWYGTPTALFLIDRYLKILSRQTADVGAVTLFPGVQFSFFGNPGIAFSLPFSGPGQWLVSFFIIGLFAYFGWHVAYKKRKLLTFAYMLFLLGAVSNLYDRVLFGHVIDYLIFFGRSAVNLADGMIISGALILLFTEGPLTPPARNAGSHR